MMPALRRLRLPPRPWIGAAVGLAAVAAAVLSVRLNGEGCTPARGSGLVSLSVRTLAPGEARSFCYKGDAGRRIRFVLARGSDGKVRSVFDACRQCYTYDKGYKLSGGDLICRLCGNRYPIDRMTSGKASCVPVTLPSRQDPDRVSIRVADLNHGSGLF